MRIIGSVEAAGVLYQAIWATLSMIDKNFADHGGSKALAIRDRQGVNHTIIHRNAKLTEVEQSLRELRHLGLKDSHLSELFNYKGGIKGLPGHIKVLVSSLT